MLRRILLLALAVYLICSVAAVQVMNAALFGRADEPDGLTVRYADVAADYPRQTVTFSSGSAQLTGWLYPAEDAAALVVIAHGLGADAEVYLPETMHLWTKDTASWPTMRPAPEPPAAAARAVLRSPPLIWMPP